MTDPITTLIAILIGLSVLVAINTGIFLYLLWKKNESTAEPTGGFVTVDRTPSNLEQALQPIVKMLTPISTTKECTTCKGDGKVTTVEPAPWLKAVADAVSEGNRELQLARELYESSRRKR